MPKGPREILVLHCNLTIDRRPQRLFAPIVRSLTIPLAISLFLSAAGCQESSEERLMGQWRGRPDSAAAWMKRKAESDAARREKAGLPPIAPRVDPAETTMPSDDEPATQLTADPIQIDDSRPTTGNATAAFVTDWEKVDFGIDLHFLPRNRIRMSLDGQSEIEGDWQMIVQSYNRATIEVRTESTAAAEATTETPSDGNPSNREIRRFVIHFEGEEKSRFTLQEEGADSDVGSLLFHRVEE